MLHGKQTNKFLGCWFVRPRAQTGCTEYACTWGTTTTPIACVCSNRMYCCSTTATPIACVCSNRMYWIRMHMGHNCNTYSLRVMFIASSSGSSLFFNVTRRGSLVFNCMWLTCSGVPNSLTFSKRGDCHFLKLQSNSYSAGSTFAGKRRLQKAAVRRSIFYPSTYPSHTLYNRVTVTCN